MPSVWPVLLTAGFVGVASLLVSCGGSSPPPTPFPNSAAFPTALSTLAPATAIGGSATAEAITGSATPGASVTGTPGELTSTPNPSGSSTPAAGGTVVAGASATSPAGSSASASSYTVKSGDTLSSIARQFNVTTAALASANSIADPNTITIGQTLKIPPPSASTPAAAGTSSPATAGTPGASAAGSSGQSYTVQAGDTACKIATANKVTLSDLASANGTTVSALSTITVGQVLKLPSPSATATSGC